MRYNHNKSLHSTPRSFTMNSSVSLRFVVIGASVAGLSCAYLLRRSGHEVVVLEKHPHRTENADGGLRVPFNMTRLLELFPGAVEMLKEKATTCSGVLFRSGESSKVLGQMVFKEELISDLGCEFYLVAYSDLINHLYDLCLSSGVLIKHGFVAKSVVTPLGSSPIVVSESGVQITADIVVAADGRDGVARQLISEEEPESDDDSLEFDFPDDCIRSATPNPDLSQLLAATLTVPISLLESDPQLAPLTREDKFVIWAGNGNSLCGGCFGRKFLLAFNMFPPTPNDIDLDWHDPAPVATLLDRIKDYDPLLQKVAGLATSCHWTIQVPPDHVSFTNQQNNVVLIGDAAHLIPINTTHNSSAALEDAVTFGRLFSRLRSRNQVPLLFNGYNQIRGKRTKQSEEVEFGGTSIVALPAGPQQDARDSALGMTLHLEGADDETLAQVWEDYLRAFNYDAVDAVDEWWLTWAKPLHDTTNGSH
ncbi:FAD/NAD(P)-binding domain-containing protein [Marasmius fiardii PR-910]|nr:FAD/NAD(P)-binding domain-containing protein [Marasmius fiardii PR-910]